MVTIRANIGKAKLALERGMHLEGELSSLLSLLSESFQRQVRSNLEGQGREFGEWKGASKWIVAKKGTSKLFQGIQERVRVRHSPTRSEVVFASPGNWSLTQHQDGFTVPPSGQLVTLDLRAPHILGVKGNKFSFISKRGSKVPGRRMWPTQTRARQRAIPLVDQWAKKLEARFT